MRAIPVPPEAKELYERLMREESPNENVRLIVRRFLEWMSKRRERCVSRLSREMRMSKKTHMDMTAALNHLGVTLGMELPGDILELVD